MKKANFFKNFFNSIQQSLKYGFMNLQSYGYILGIIQVENFVPLNKPIEHIDNKYHKVKKIPRHYQRVTFHKVRSK